MKLRAHHCAARALVLKAISLAPNASERVRAIAQRFTGIYEHERDVRGTDALTAYWHAHAAASALSDRLAERDLYAELRIGAAL